METKQIETEELKEELAPIAQKATAIVVRNNEEHLACVDYLKENKAAQARIHDKFDPIVKAAHESHKKACALLSEMLAPFEAGYKRAHEVDKAYQIEQERIRIAEQARLQAIEAEKARKAREAAEAQARIQREKEQAAQREADKARALAAMEQDKARREQLIKEAEARQKEAAKASAMAQAREEKAAAVIETVVTVASSVDKAGSSLSKSWVAEVVSMDQLIAGATEPGSVARTFIMVDDSVMQKFAKATKGSCPVKGVKFSEVTGMRIRTK